MSNEVVLTVQKGLGHECFQSTWNMWISFQESFNKNWSRITGEDPLSWLLIWYTLFYANFYFQTGVISEYFKMSLLINILVKTEGLLVIQCKI